MSTSLDARIHEHIERYLGRSISLSEFEDWLVPATWDVRHSEDASAGHVSAQILLHLAEHSDGWLSEAELRQRLREMLAVPSPRSR